MTPLTEGWLSSSGFKWLTIDSMPREAKHWILWLGDVVDRRADGSRIGFSSFDDLGVEVSTSVTGGEWNVWLRADCSGRYSRFIHIRHVWSAEQLIEIIEGVTGQRWNAENNWYGSMCTPEVAARRREDHERLDHKIARSVPWKGDERDDTKLTPRGGRKCD